MEFFMMDRGMAQSLDLYPMERPMMGHVAHGLEQPVELFDMEYTMTSDTLRDTPDLLGMENYLTAEQTPALYAMNYFMADHIAAEQTLVPAVPEPPAMESPELVNHAGRSSPQPASQSRKRRVCSNEQWEKLKPIIEPLWLRDKKTFPEIAKILAKYYNFHPTKRQFDRIVILWNWRRNIRQQDMKTVVFREQHRSADGRKTAARIDGQEVSIARIDRWKQRHTKLNGQIAPSERRNTKPEDLQRVSTSSASKSPKIECYTPKDSSDDGALPLYPHYGNVDITDSPKLSRLIESLLIDIPTLQLDSNSEAAMSDQLIKPANTTASERRESVSLPESLTVTSLAEAIPPASRPITLVVEVSPFPYRLPEYSKRPSSVQNSALPYKQAEETQYRRQLSQLKARSYSDTSPEFLSTLFKLGEVFIDQGVYKDAEKIFRHIANSRKRILTYEDVGTLNAYCHLGKVFYERDRFKQAQQILQSVYKTALRTLGPDHEVSVLSIELMSRCVYALGDFEKSDILGRQVLQIRLQKLGPRHESSIEAMVWLGWILQAATALDLCRIALQISNDAGDTLEECAVDASMAVAFNLRIQGRVDESLRLLQSSLHKSKYFYGLNHQQTLSCQSEISETLLLMKRFPESEQITRYTLEQLRKLHQAQGLFHALVHQLSISALILTEINRLDEAEKGYLTIINYLRDRNGVCDGATVDAFGILGEFYEKQGRLGDAIAIYKQVHEEFELAGVENRNSLSILGRLAHGFYNSNHYDDAANCSHRLIDQSSRLLGETHKKTLVYFQWLGECYGIRKQYDKQVEACRPIYEILRLSAVENEHTMEMSSYFGRSLYRAKLFDEAARCFQSLIEQQERLLGKTHQETLMSFKWLGDCYGDREHYDKQVEVCRPIYETLQLSAVENEHTMDMFFYFGISLYSAKLFEEAATCFHSLIEQQERFPGEDYKTTILYYEKLGDCYTLQSKYKEQLELYQQKSERFNGFEIGNREELRIAFLLAFAQFNAGYHQDAVESFCALKEKEEKILGPQHKHTLNSHYWLRDCSINQEQNDLYYELCSKTATPHLEKCRMNINADIGNEPPLGLLRAFCAFLITEEPISVVRTFFVRLLEKRMESLGPNNITTIDVMAILGWVAEADTEYETALSLYEVAANSYKKLQSEGEVVDEKIVLWLEQQISQPEFLARVRAEVASKAESSESDERETDDSNDAEEESEDSDTEMMWNNLVEFEDLDEILPADIGVI